jgi:hypothetical protein
MMLVFRSFKNRFHLRLKTGMSKDAKGFPGKFEAF